MSAEDLKGLNMTINTDSFLKKEGKCTIFTFSPFLQQEFYENVFVLCDLRIKDSAGQVFFSPLKFVFLFFRKRIVAGGSIALTLSRRGKSGQHRASCFLTGRGETGNGFVTESAAENNRPVHSG